MPSTDKPEAPRFFVLFVDEAIDALGLENCLGCDKGDDCFVLVDRQAGVVVGSDGGEPEDQTLVRDWNWIVSLLNKVNDDE